MYIWLNEFVQAKNFIKNRKKTVEPKYFIHLVDSKSGICQNMYIQKYTELRLIPILSAANTKLSEKPWQSTNLYKLTCSFSQPAEG